MKRGAEEVVGAPEKQLRLSAEQLYHEPSNDELQLLQLADQAGSLASTDLLRLQISELLTEVSLKSARRKQIDNYISKLSEKLKSLEPSNTFKLKDQSWLRSFNVKTPLSLKYGHVKGSFCFLPPEQVHVIGSYAMNTCIKPDPHVDIALELPKGWVHAKDYLNQTYLRKRALYLVCLAQQLQAWSEGVNDLHFTYHHGNHMKPVLLVTPAGKLGNHIEVRIHTVFEEHHFMRARFHVNKNNIRKACVGGKPDSAGDEEGGPDTPHYNTLMLHDMTLTRHSRLLCDTLRGVPSLRDGIRLLKVWLRQRHLHQGYGSFSGFLMTMYVLHLVRTNKLNATMTPFLVFRTTLALLEQVKWHEKGISLCSYNNNDSKPKREDFHKHFPVVFVDDTGDVNLCAGMTVNTLNRVKYEAGLAVKFIESPGVDYIDALFIKNLSFVAACDQSFILSSLDDLSRTVKKLKLSERVLDHSGSHVTACLDQLLVLVDKAIGRRVHFLFHTCPQFSKWAVGSAPPRHVQAVTLGVLLNHDTATSVLDKGPAADSPQADEFRKFWGDKSELRRFQDGTICEAVLWPAESQQQRRDVLGHIVAYVLERHAAISSDHLTAVYGQLDSLLEFKQQPKVREEKRSSHDVIKTGTGEEDAAAYMDVYGTLCKCLRKLSLPLTIHAINGLSPQLRFTEVFPVQPVTFDINPIVEARQMFPRAKLQAVPFVPAPTVVCMLEGSGKWPEDVQAIRRIKAAFLLQMADKLNHITGLLAVPKVDHVDVLLAGYVFRLQIGYSHEILLLRRQKLADGRVLFEDNEASRQLQYQLHGLPPLASSLTGLHHAHGSFSVGVRLAKRWVASQMLLGDHVPHEAIELIGAHLYLQPAPYALPGSALTCFLRFLQFLATFDWKSQPLLINLNDEFTKEDFAEIKKNFEENRSKLPIMFIASPTDNTSSWTRLQPSGPVLSRLALLARESLTVLQCQLSNISPETDFRCIFRPPLDAYDVVIRLQCCHLARGFQAVDVGKDAVLPDYGRHEPDELENMPVVDMDLVQRYLREIRGAFGELALFFHDQYGGDVIGMLWKPRRCASKPFSREQVSCHMPDTTCSDIQLVPNAEAILSDLRFMGQGLVESVEPRHQHWPF